ncbi:MAG: sigma 54-interacting transcriptional regulator [Candidatus Latescibacterota bacterium]|jgi:transcriptional regulator with GAF, ATPase, and Fis domain
MRVVDENEFFREVTLRICSSLELEEALGRAFEYLSRHIPMDVLTLLYYDPERAAAFVTASFSPRGGGVGADERNPLFAMDQATLDRLRHEGASVNREHAVRIVNRPRRDPFYRAIAEHLGTRGLRSFSYLMLRLDVEAAYQGVLSIAAAGHDRFEPAHAHLVRLVGGPFAIAMSNARRYAEALRLRDRLAEDNRAMHRELEHLSGDQVIGAHFGLRRVMELVRQVAPMNAPVLLLGDTGTGKEVIANAIHLASSRRDGPLVRVQCGAIPDALLDSELFGHERGAFTGAVQAKRGRFERADGGTLFFDEIGELTLEAQVKLLRVLQDKRFERLGGSQTLEVDVRVVVATNRDLQRAVAEGRFREDLWFRLNVFPIHLPPLRQRREDIPALVQWFLERKGREMGLAWQPRLAPGAIEQLQAYDWPGNVRELQNVIERALILSRGEELAFPALGASPVTRPSVPAAEAIAGEVAPLDLVVAAHIRLALTAAGGRVQGESGAASLLAVNPSTLRARMRKLGIRFGRRASG